jgi:putative membrane protein
MILITFFLSLSGRFSAHKRLARFTFPIWLYVSVTGVIVYAMLAAWR